MFTRTRFTTGNGGRGLHQLAISLLAGCSLIVGGCAGLVSQASNANSPVAPTILTQPASQTVMVGQTATFTVAASGTAPLSYRWMKNAATVAGATSASYTTPPTLSSDNGAKMIVVVTDSAGSATSSAATLTVSATAVAPSITTQPVNETVTTGQTATFSVVAAGTAPLSYQWKKNGTAIAGATSASYTTPTTVSSDNGAQFLVVVSNTAGSATSSAATLTVSATAVAPSITTQPVNETVTTGQTATFSVVAAGTAPLSYQWKKNGTAIAGATSASYTTPTTVSSDNGAQFLVVVSNTAGSATSSAATLTVSATAVAPSITTQPVSSTVTTGQKATFSVVAAGTAPLSYQWKKNGTAIAGATSASYTTPATVSSDNGAQFLVVVSNTAGSATSNAATLTVSGGVAAPGVPSGLSATAASSTQINLSWTAPSGTVTSYNILRGGTQIGTSTTTTYQDSGLTASTSYTYNVSASNSAGTSGLSAGASATTLASGGSGNGIPSALGWYQIPSTLFASACPNYADISGTTGCTSVVGDWSGAVADTTRNRLLIWGGGHDNYYGNEVYSLNLTANPITLTRLNEPTRFTSNPVACNNGAYWDGNPCSRHTYDLITYSPTADQMIVFGGSETPSGSFCSEDMWSLAVGTLTWTPKGSGNWNCNSVYSGSAYDPNSGLIYFADTGSVSAYNTTNSSFTGVGGAYGQRNSLAYSSLVVDPLHKYLFLMGGDGGGGTGGSLYRWSIANPTNLPAPTDLLASATGCSAWLGTTTTNPAPYGPGVQWDPVRNEIIMWNGGNSIGVYDPVANACTTETYTGGPGAQQATGTYGRFSYFPQLGVFAVVNSATQNAYTLRIDSTGGTGGSGPVISGVTTSAITTSGATIGWTTNAAATSQVEYGTTASYGTMTTLNSTQVTSHSVTLTGLAAGTTYHYAVLSTNSGGSQTSSDAVFTTNSNTDTTPPTVSIPSPASGATVSGTITVTASASDNVGVASVQFLLDGVNLGSADTAAPYQASWNTTTATNGTHVLTAQAVDSSNNVGNSTAVTVTVSNSTTTADQNFQQRCAAPGVLNCQGLDTVTTALQSSDANMTDGFSGNGTKANDNLDTSIFISGGGSIRMTWPANFGTDNCCQNWTSYFGQGSKNTSFGNNSDFYVQFGFRADSNWTSRFVTDSFPKLFIMHSIVGQSCSNMSMVMVDTHALDLPQMYTNCSGNSLVTCSDGIDWTSGGCGSGDIYGQQGWTDPEPFTGYECGYNGGAWSGPNCFHFTANQWYTIYVHVQIGTFSSANSTVEVWVSPYGQQLTKLLNVHNLVITSDGSAGYNVIDLTQYMTAHTGSNLETNVWFDELIISSQPIPAPAGQTPQD